MPNALHFQTSLVGGEERNHLIFTEYSTNMCTPNNHWNSCEDADTVLSAY